jgi:hypothetical protein
MDDRTPEELAALQNWYTVVGIWPETKERYQEYVQAVSSRQAEDLARMTAQDKGGVFWVAGVYEGQLVAQDTYATFADDPDKTTQADF